MSSKILIAYYSYSGNTRKIAEMIKKKINADIVEIETVTTYTKDYNAVVEQGRDEINRGHRPPIKPINVDINKYDTIILGTPVWWYTMAPAVLTFLSENDMKDKKIIPFATNGGWLGHTFKDIKKICSEAKVENAMDISFSESSLHTPIKKVEKWIDSILETQI